MRYGKSNYGGGLGYGPIASESYDAADTAVRAQQAIHAATLLKAWQKERLEPLIKAKQMAGELRRVGDGLNDFIEHKKGLTWNEIRELESTFHERAKIANDLQKALVEDFRQRMVKAGVTTSLGYNFYDLRGPAFLVYPENVPFVQSMARWGKQNAGYGTVVHWKATTLSPGTSYAGAAEGKRVAIAAPNEVDYLATYKELGIERGVSFTAQFAGEGYTDNVADEHLRGLQELRLQEESLILGGNSGTGTGNLGFALGTANTPTGTLVTGVTGVFTNGHYISAYVVELTMLGNPSNAQFGYQAAPTVAAGLVPSFTRTNADGTTDTINGGMGVISAGSATTQVATANSTVKFTVNAKAGAVAWAWFIDDEATNTSVAANAVLFKITTVPYYTPTAADITNKGTQAANFTGSSTDHSFETLDFDGLLSYAAKSGTWLNMSDLTLTSPVTGATNTGLLTPGMTGSTNPVPAVQEIEYDLGQQWSAFQTVADAIWCDFTTKRAITAAIFKASSGVPAYRFEVQRDAQGNILGGVVVDGYKSLYSMKASGSDEIPLRIHPMIPPGTMIYDKERNPYPSSRLPGVRGLFVQRDYYSIEWPVVTRQWTFGTYAHEVLGHYIPGLLTLRTGVIGSS